MERLRSFGLNGEILLKFFEENSAELDDDTEEIIDTFIDELDVIYTLGIELKTIS